MHGCRKSDSSIVPENTANNYVDMTASAEQSEERELAKSNRPKQNRLRTLSRESLKRKLEPIRERAVADKQASFTTLWHHVYDIERLRECFHGLKRNSAVGVDRQTWQSYLENLEEHLQDLSARLRQGAYHAKPVRRVYIPKPDGRQRPLGIPALEDKIVQAATAQVLSAIYETDFKDFSHGFRPGRGQHDALDALTVGIEEGKVSFDFLGFTHICSKTQNGKFCVLRQTQPKKMKAKLKDLRLKLTIRMHVPVHEVGQWLRSVVEGHYNYYGVPRNLPALYRFHKEVIRLWMHALKRRSQKNRITWERMEHLIARWLPRPTVRHPYPDQRSLVMTQGRSPVR
jgi:hypothetical protein